MKKRAGIIGIKVGMSQFIETNGNALPVTLIHIQPNTVIKNKEYKNKKSVVLAAGEKKNMLKPLKGIAKKANLESFRWLHEFTTNEDLIVGVKLTIDRFMQGGFIDIRAKTKGKGFAGTMKRHNFRGLEASHGVSISHRSAGSTGQCQDPGKVFKGKKMAGHLGAVRVTTQNLQVVKTDADRGLILVKGAVPGSKGGWVTVKDAVKKPALKDAPRQAAIRTA